MNWPEPAPRHGELRIIFRRRPNAEDARLGKLEGDPAVFEAIGWSDGEFEIDFAASSDRTNTTRSTTGLLMEAMRLMDEASNSVES